MAAAAAATTTTTLPLAQLVEDLTIYPRHAVDDSHVAQLVLAMRAGTQLPPIVVDKASMRIVDGWHRTRAARRLHGPTGAIEGEVHRYESEAALLEDAIRRNAAHGRRLDRIDQVRAVVLLEQAGVAPERIAAVLSVPAERVQRLRVRVAIAPESEEGAVPGTHRIVLKRPLAHLAGTELTEDQARAQAAAPGTSYLLVARQLHDAVTHRFLNTADDRLMAALGQLHKALGSFLAAGPAGRRAPPEAPK